MHRIAAKRAAEYIVVLLRAGCDPSLCDEHKKTAQQMDVRRKFALLDPEHAETCRLLRSSVRREACEAAAAEEETARCCGDANGACELLFSDDPIA